MNKINFVRHYKHFNADVFEVVYKSNRVLSYYDIDAVPKTVLKFIKDKEPKRQVDSFNREELIYS